MKTLSFYAVILFSIFSFTTLNAQTVKKETIKVWGNCGMCKTKIEKAARSAGAATANWNEDSKELKVTYPVNKTSGTKIQEAIAKTGYDTQDFTADNSAYEKLHACCQYERKDSAVVTTDKNCCSNMTGQHDCKMNASGNTCCSKGKSNCKMSAATSSDKECCAGKTCDHDGKMDNCKDMACCKEILCCSKKTGIN